MNIQDKFTEAGFQVSSKSQNPENYDSDILQFLKENYPQTIRGNEIKWDELKSALGLPIDEKVNGYGLNFVGRNVANAKYKQKTTKELKYLGSVNPKLKVGSLKMEDGENLNFSNFQLPTSNLLLKGDNLDCLKILKSYYSGKIKCIYIDPPYNTAGDQFIYPDKFDKEEAEVLGLANISDADFDRMQFSFQTKKSHNGWLSFMYPRLMLARDLLAKDGVIFISIDDNEQANLKLLCDEIFGEENFVETFINRSNPRGNQAKKYTASEHEYILSYAKNINLIVALGEVKDEMEFDKEDENGKYIEIGLRKRGAGASRKDAPNQYYPIYFSMETNEISTIKFENAVEILPKLSDGSDGRWRWSFKSVEENKNLLLVRLVKRNGIREYDIFEKKYFTGDQIKKEKSIIYDKGVNNENATEELTELFDGKKLFDFPKPVYTIKKLLKLSTYKNSLILDFFAGSGTTGHAVMQLNAEDGGNRKFILCQIDEPIHESKPAYQFCIENNLPPVISSITIERLKRAGEKIEDERKKKEVGSWKFEENDTSSSNFQLQSSNSFMVFDLVDAPKLEIDENGQIAMQNTDNDPLSRIYNMIFSVGIDNPTATPECVLENCLYKIGNNYYITNSEELDKSENKHFLSEAIKNGKVFIDGWTASINTTLQNYKEDVKIVF